MQMTLRYNNGSPFFSSGERLSRVTVPRYGKPGPRPDVAVLEENNVKACLPLDFTQEQYDTEDRQLVVALSVTLGLFAIELAGFFSGVSMFNCSQSLLSLAAHCSGSVSLSFFVFEKWECWTYWVIFATCSVLPALVEILLFIAVFGLKKKPL
uniref:Transmembrane protein 107 n=1 Tax=Astatotilapia calliptera TaxID=8154 RepID=A0A3P8QFV9_ASTCA